MNRFPCNHIYWPENLETAFIAVAFLLHNDQQACLFLTRPVLLFLWLDINFIIMVNVNHYLIYPFRTHDRAFTLKPSYVEIGYECNGLDLALGKILLESLRFWV